MHTHVGLIGPTDLVERVQELNREFPSLVMLPHAYGGEEEAVAAAEALEKRADILLFTGPVPYYLARAALTPSIPWLHISYTGSSLLRTLLLLCQDGVDITQLSLDTLERRVVEEVYDELGLPSDRVITKEYRGPITRDELVGFHLRLWREKKVPFTVTCLSSAERELHKRGVPVARIIPTRATIRNSLRLAVAEGEGLRSKSTQVAMMILNVDHFERLAKRSASEYELQRTRLDLHELLIKFAEEVQGSLVFVGGDEFVVVTTRGGLEEATLALQSLPVLDEIRRRLGITASVGIGLGRTANQAAKHARLGLEKAKSSGGNCAFALLDDQRVLGPLGTEKRLEYDLRNIDREISEMAEAANVSPTTLSKVASLVRMVGRSTLTANDLAEGFGVTLRSARRILNSLEEGGLAKVVGEEQPVGRGRPRQVYSIRLRADRPGGGRQG